MRDEANPHSLALQEFLLPTPSSTAKLLAAWDGLQVESQIYLLKNLPPKFIPQDAERIFLNALNNVNAYVRYLGAKSWWQSKIKKKDELASADLIVLEKIKSDTDPLVRFVAFEGKWVSDFDPAAFFGFPHEARLAIVRRYSVVSNDQSFEGVLRGTGPAEKVAELVNYALEELLPNAKITEKEIFEIVIDYVGGAAFRDQYKEMGKIYAHDDRVQRASEQTAPMWNLVPKAPKVIADFLIEYLPAVFTGSDWGELVPDSVLENLNDQQLSVLFWRKDVDLYRARRKIFFEQDREKYKTARHWAVRLCFNITLDELEIIVKKAISEILEKKTLYPKSAALDDLHSLSQARDLSPVCYDIISNVIWKIASDPSDFRYADFASACLKEKLKTPYDVEKHSFDIRLYRCAVESVPWPCRYREPDKPIKLRDPLKFLESGIKFDDTLTTFKNFKELWEQEIKRGTTAFIHQSNVSSGRISMTSLSEPESEEAYYKHLMKNLPPLYEVDVSEIEGDWDLKTQNLKADFNDLVDTLRPEKRKENRKLINGLIASYANAQEKFKKERDHFTSILDMLYAQLEATKSLIIVLFWFAVIWSIGGIIVHHFF